MPTVRQMKVADHKRRVAELRAAKAPQPIQVLSKLPKAAPTGTRTCGRQHTGWNVTFLYLQNKGAALMHGIDWDDQTWTHRNAATI